MHVFNNYYRIKGVPSYGYSWGVGIESAIYAENNFFKTDDAVTPDQFIERFHGTAIQASGTVVNGTHSRHLVDVVAEWNAVNDPDLAPTVGWVPTLFTRVEATRKVPTAVQKEAGVFAWCEGPSH